MSSAERHSQLDIGILGPLEVRVAGHPVPLGGRRQRAVLALLLLHANEVVSCDRLIDDLWHGQPPDSALSVLRTYVSHLRKALHAGEAWQDQPLKTRSPGYVFQLGAEDLDAARFERLLERGRALLAGGDAATASSSLHEGLHLWRGPALGEFANTDFAQPEAVRLEELRLAAIEECFEAGLALGRHAEVASRGDSLLRQQPLRERLAGQLMLALYRSGRQAEALSVYGRIREALLEDLGIEPGAQLQALQQAILLQRPELDWRPPEEAAEADRAPPAPGSERSAAQWNVPARNAAFTGRLRLLRYMRTVLESAQSTTGVRVAVLHGLGGVGKTQLATEYLHRHADDYLLGWWIPAQEPLTLLGALADLAAALGVSTEAEQRRVLTSLWAELRQRDRWILVYDNAEDPEALRGFVPPAGHGHVLITSRNPGWGAFGRGIAVDVLHRREAVAFLDRRCGVQKGSAVLAEELGDLPLALEQAAAYCEQTGLDLGEYVSLFRSRREALLARGEPADYGGTVRATWRLAFEQLEMRSPAAGQLLRLLAFLAPEAVPFELLREHAASLPGELGSAAADELAFHDAVAALLRFSLVDRGPSGLRLHRLVQMVMRAELAPAERTAWAARAVELLSEAVPSDPTDPSAWPRWRQLAPHVSAATAHAQALEVAERPAADLLHLVGVSLHCQAKLSSARTFLERALALRRALHGDDHPAVGDTFQPRQRPPGRGRFLRRSRGAGAGAADPPGAAAPRRGTRRVGPAGPR